MNKKIYKLAVEVGIIVEEDGYFWIKSVDELEKFAELLIRECAKIADFAEENKCEWIGGNILIHFGVKE